MFFCHLCFVLSLCRVRSCRTFKLNPKNKSDLFYCCKERIFLIFSLNLSSSSIGSVELLLFCDVMLKIVFGFKMNCEKIMRMLNMERSSWGSGIILEGLPSPSFRFFFW